MPLIWNNKVDHLSGRKKNLTTHILNYNLEKLSKKHMDCLRIINISISKLNLALLKLLTIWVSSWRRIPDITFLAHTGVFKAEQDTAKCSFFFL